ncbi:hypothetical protein HDU76_009887 [Blyttiomyces sp. JEL0837]|nr:hypothetical protein HDU76_009887 [Blyttiomyces sp. JEL0837]
MIPIRKLETTAKGQALVDLFNSPISRTVLNIKCNQRIAPSPSATSDNNIPDITTNTTTTSAATQWRGGFLDFADIVVQVADLLGIKQFAQMGFSCGCVYSLAVAYRYPERLLPNVPMQFFGTWVPQSVLKKLIPSSDHFSAYTFGILLNSASLLSTTMYIRMFRGDVPLGNFSGLLLEFSSSISTSISTAIMGSDSLTDEEEAKILETLDEKDELAEDMVDRIESRLSNRIKFTKIMMANPELSPFEAEQKYRDSFKSPSSSSSSAVKKSQTTSPQTPPTQTPPMSTIITIPTPTPTPPSTPKSSRKQSNFRPGAPIWLHTDISAELYHLTRRPYIEEGLTSSFLHCIERTSPLGFCFSDVGHPVSAYHGAVDSLVPVDVVKTIANVCGWEKFKRCEKVGHGLPGVAVVREALREVAERARNIANVCRWEKFKTCEKVGHGLPGVAVVREALREVAERARV